MGGFLNDDFEDYQESRPAPKGRYDLKIVAFTKTETTDKTAEGGNPSRPMIRLGMQIQGHDNENYDLANVNITGTEKGDRGHSMQMMTAKRLAYWFNIDQGVFTRDIDEMTEADFKGAEASDIPVSVSTYQGRKYSNVDLPRLPDEA